jgi:tRNA (cytidine32/uridine32-2'-O)-methyltransferase
MEPLKNIRIILVNTSHPGNIGAVARAMKTMGLNTLYLVAPKIFPHAEATARAAGADDILAQATITNSLNEAIKSCNLVIGASARQRTLPLQVFDPKAAAKKIVTECPTNEIAIIFGRENNGLTNEELMLCNYHINIPTNDNFSSLNLAAAVQIIAYEIKMSCLDNNVSQSQLPQEPLATIEEMTGFYNHLEKILIATNFLDSKNPGKLMLRLKRLFNRARCEQTEISILRGILSSIEDHNSL